MNGESLKGHLDYLLLAALRGLPAHGYAIAERLRARTDNALDLPEGTLYPALHRLQRAGLLTSTWGSHNGRRRRIYQLTAKGLRALEERHAAWHSFARAVRGVVEGTA
ncbi:MAG TPA: helix-turn-helix transcriptional regulator [Gemmatimonadales bacterium]|jgi:DNA-binding PadR family transcriptional regulator